MSFVPNADVLPGSGKKEFFGAFWGGLPCNKPFDADRLCDGKVAAPRTRSPSRCRVSNAIGFRFHYCYLHDL
jgi:hypothetical protein